METQPKMITHSNAKSAQNSRAPRVVGSLLLGVGLATLLAACSSNWVQITPEGQPVVAVTAADVANCTRIGVASVNALDSIAFIDRGARRLQQELVTLARNEAGRMGGNRVTPESTIEDGRQTFGVFRC